jgi:hypothetical protein
MGGGGVGSGPLSTGRYVTQQGTADLPLGWHCTKATQLCLLYAAGECH